MVNFSFKLFFLGRRKGFLLTVCLQLRAKRSQAHRATVANVVKLSRAPFSFASCYALATTEGRPSPKPSPAPLHVRCGDIALLFEQSVAG